MEKRNTPAGNTYWDDNGAYQKEHDKLFDQLVPAQGDAETVHGELVRVSGRLYYEYCNNGNCNAVECDWEEEEWGCYNCNGTGEVDYGEEDLEECNDCYGSGVECEEVEGEKYIDSYYQSMLEFIVEHVPGSYTVVEKLETFMLHGPGYAHYQFSNEEYKYYNDVVDTIMHFVLNSENKPNPEYKPEKDNKKLG